MFSARVPADLLAEFKEYADLFKVPQAQLVEKIIAREMFEGYSEFARFLDEKATAAESAEERAEHEENARQIRARIVRIGNALKEEADGPASAQFAPRLMQRNESRMLAAVEAAMEGHLPGADE